MADCGFGVTGSDLSGAGRDLAGSGPYGRDPSFAPSLIYKLALAKLFFDQALPSAGLSGSIVVDPRIEKQEAYLARRFLLAQSSTPHHSSLHTRSHWRQQSRFCFFWGAQLSCSSSPPFYSYFLVRRWWPVFLCFRAGIFYGAIPTGLFDIGLSKSGWLYERRGSTTSPQFPSSVNCFMLPAGHFSLDAMTLWMLIRSVGATGPAQSCVC